MKQRSVVEGNCKLLAEGKSKANKTNCEMKRNLTDKNNEN